MGRRIGSGNFGEVCAQSEILSHVSKKGKNLKISQNQIIQLQLNIQMKLHQNEL